MAAQGTTNLDFGVFPGKSDASVAVTGQTGILSGSLVEAWLLPAATADHSADEHLVEAIKVLAGNIVAGTGFTIYGICTSELQVKDNPTVARAQASPRIYGLWKVAWVWN
jgi:hypothetical protein